MNDVKFVGKLAAFWVAVLLAISVTFSACGSDSSREDAVDTNDVDKSAPHVIAFNNHYANVETKCDNGNRLYVVTKGNDRLDIVESDPSCGGKK